MKIRKKQNWKKQLRQDIQNQTEKESVLRNQYYQEIYDKPKIEEFKTAELLNMDKFFFMPKLNDYWTFGKDNNNSLALYPVICSRSDFRDKIYIQISRGNIAKLAGISKQAVDDGISHIIDNDYELYNDENEARLKLLDRKLVQDGRRRYYEYLAGILRTNNEDFSPKKWSRYFPFYTCIIDSGIWAGLSRKAKALYIAMRSEARFNSDLYEELENVSIYDVSDDYHWDHSGKEIDDYADFAPEIEKFKKRKWELCDVPLTTLFELVGMPMNYKITKDLFQELERNGLAIKLHDTKPVFQVWLKPKKFSNRRIC